MLIINTTMRGATKTVPLKEVPLLLVISPYWSYHKQCYPTRIIVCFDGADWFFLSDWRILSIGEFIRLENLFLCCILFIK